jgi:hypothetical protein
MKRFLALLLTSALGLLTIGCDSQKGTSEKQNRNDELAEQGRQDSKRDDHERYEDKNHYSSRWRQGD